MADTPLRFDTNLVQEFSAYKLVAEDGTVRQSDAGGDPNGIQRIQDGGGGNTNLFEITYTGSATGIHYLVFYPTGSNPGDGYTRVFNLDDTTAVHYPVDMFPNGKAVAAIKAETDKLDGGTAVAGVSMVEALRRIGATTVYKISGAGTGTETFSDWANSANTIVVTVDASGNRSNVVFN